MGREGVCCKRGRGRAGDQCGEAHGVAPSAGFVFAAVGTHFHGISRVVPQGVDGQRIVVDINQVFLVTVPAQLPSFSITVFTPAQIHTVFADVVGGKCCGIGAGHQGGEGNDGLMAQVVVAAVALHHGFVIRFGSEFRELG